MKEINNLLTFGGFIVGLGGLLVSLITSLITALLGYLNIKEVRKERQYMFNKEQLFKLEERAHKSLTAVHAYRKVLENMELDLTNRMIVLGKTIPPNYEELKQSLFNDIIIYFPEVYGEYEENGKYYKKIIDKYFYIVKQVENNPKYNISIEDSSEFKLLFKKFYETETDFIKKLQDLIIKKRRELTI